ncbi:MAG: hypothetical protein ACI8ZM_002328 [Crocinitomix sp.]|jgi:hypothetical protein
MKIVLSFIMLGLVSISFGQDSTKTTTKVGVQRATTTGAQSLPNISFKKLGAADSKIDIEGKFIIEQYSLQINSSDAKKAIKAVGTTLEISDTIIAGTDIDTISYQVSDSEIMNTEDYLFRIFGEVPENIPADLPVNVWVHKTDNLECYGIAQLSDGRVLIPYNGLLLYLRRY